MIVDSDTRDIIVYVYSDLCQTLNSNPALCDDLQLPEALPLVTSTDYKSLHTGIIRPSKNGSFLVNQSRQGDLTLVFLQDKERGRDRTIDPEDVTVTRDAQGNIVPAADNVVAVLTNSPS